MQRHGIRCTTRLLFLDLFCYIVPPILLLETSVRYPTHTWSPFTKLGVLETKEVDILPLLSLLVKDLHHLYKLRFHVNITSSRYRVCVTHTSFQWTSVSVVGRDGLQGQTTPYNRTFVPWSCLTLRCYFRSSFRLGEIASTHYLLFHCPVNSMFRSRSK